MTAVKFTKESDLCAAFIAALNKPRRHERETEKWTAYSETAGFDILLVRDADGFQIGVEAKLRLNAHVVCQALPDYLWTPVTEGPDCRAVLVPGGMIDNGLGTICTALGITVIRCYGEDAHLNFFEPGLPEINSWQPPREWFEWAPLRRCTLPGYVPDVVAGASAPVSLTLWKVAAIKLAILLEERPVTRADFAHLNLSASRWLQSPSGWLRKADDGGGWVAGPYMPDFKAQHPVNWEQIKADRDAWEPKVEPSKKSVQGELL